MTRINRIILPLLFPFLIILLWYFAVRFHWVDGSYAASPEDVVKKIFQLFTDKESTNTGYFPLQIVISLGRLFVGILVGCIMGIAAAFINTSFKKIDKLVSPTLSFLAPIPVVIWIPFFIMIFGTSDIYKIGLIAIATFFLIYINLYTAYSSINKNYLEIGEIYEKNLIERFRYIYFPYGLESLFTTLRLCIAIGWIVIYVTEYGDAEEKLGGLGYFIAHNRAMGNIEEKFAGVIVLAALSFTMDYLVRLAQKHYLKWQNKSEP